MLERNVNIKACPERFQSQQQEFDIVFTCEERYLSSIIYWISHFNFLMFCCRFCRVFDTACVYLPNRRSITNNLVHVVNVEITDDAKNAEIGALHILALADSFSTCMDLDQEIDGILNDFEEETGAKLSSCC